MKNFLQNFSWRNNKGLIILALALGSLLFWVLMLGSIDSDLPKICYGSKQESSYYITVKGNNFWNSVFNIISKDSDQACYIKVSSFLPYFIEYLVIILVSSLILMMAKLVLKSFFKLICKPIKYYAKR